MKRCDRDRFHKPLGMFLSLTVLAGIVPMTGLLRGQNRDVFYWDLAVFAYDTYVNCPTPVNARKLLDSLPADRPTEINGDSQRALRHIFDGDNYLILQNETLFAGSTNLEIYFRLLNITDGGVLENVLAELGSLLRVEPQMFLEVLMRYKDSWYIKTWGYPVTFQGTGYNSHRSAAIYDYEKRIEALEKVRNPKYSRLKDDCINLLRRAIKQ